MSPPTSISMPQTTPRGIALSARLKPFLRILKARWVRLWHRHSLSVSGMGNYCDLSNAYLYGGSITINGSNNHLEIGQGTRFWDVNIRLSGDNLRCHIGTDIRLRGGTFVVEDDGSRLEIGDNTTMTQPVIFVAEGVLVRFGKDCMVGYGSDIRASDAHAVIADGRRLNGAQDIVIGNHVWLCIQTQVLKGVTIGDDVVAASHSVLTHPVPAATMVAGNPAQVIRTGVTWSRDRMPID